MMTRLRTFLTAAGILAAAAIFQPSARAQGFGSMFSSFSMSGVSGDEMEASTVITAGSADIDLENNIIVLIGNVVVDDKSSRITCDRMEIYLDEDAADSLVGTADKPEDEGETAEPPRDSKEPDEKEKEADGPDEKEDKKNIKRIDCVGNVVFRKRANPDDPGEDDQIALADRANYDVVKEIIVLTGAHSGPEKVVPETVFRDMMRQIRSNSIARCPVMMQGENWMVGDSFTILLQEDNRLKVKNMKFNYTGDSFLPDDRKDEKDGSDAKADGKKTSALISSNDADIFLEHNIITLTGNVDIDQESDQPVRMTCNKMEIILVDDVPAESVAAAESTVAKDGKAAADSGKKASEIHCTGDFVYRKSAGQDADGGDQIAMSDRADYDAEKDILVLTGKPVMMQGPNKVHGARIEIYPGEDNRMAIDTMKAYYTGKALLSSSDQDDTDATTLITADKADIRPDETITLSKNVVVDDGAARITCARMEIVMQKDSSSSLFNFNNKPAGPDAADKKDENELGNDISKIICSGDVVYRKNSDTNGREQIVLSREARFDAATEVIDMIGAHSNPKGTIPQGAYDEIARMVAKDKQSGATVNSFEPYSIMMQGSNWIAGTPIRIFPKEGNRIQITSMRAGVRQSSRSGSSAGEDK